MTPENFAARIRELCAEAIPNPGSSQTPERHRRLFAIGREDLSLAKIMEAHWDAHAILAEAGRTPAPGALYAVWASENPNSPLLLRRQADHFTLTGTKAFASGAGLADRALLTATEEGLPVLVEADMRGQAGRIAADNSGWHSEAFRLTNTATLTFANLALDPDAIRGPTNWYTDRPGFWNGAIGPAACWAGGAAGLLDFAMQSRRGDPHTLAHLGAMHANVAAMQSILETIGREIDADPLDRETARIRALTTRHSIEQLCTDTLRRFARAYGPYPLALNAETARRYQELDLYLRQSHAERDLQSLGEALHPTAC